MSEATTKLTKRFYIDAEPFWLCESEDCEGSRGVNSDTQCWYCEEEISIDREPSGWGFHTLAMVDNEWEDNVWVPCGGTNADLNGLRESE